MQTRQWAVEYARQGVRVVSVSPGAIDTPMVRATLAAQGGEEALANRHPLGRLGKADEVANAVLWLASEDAAFITGTDLEVDGGLGSFRCICRTLLGSAFKLLLTRSGKLSEAVSRLAPDGILAFNRVQGLLGGR